MVSFLNTRNERMYSSPAPFFMQQTDKMAGLSVTSHINVAIQFFQKDK